MMNLTVLFSVLTIYIGAVIGVFGAIVYPELRNFGSRSDTFRRDYQDKVQVLKVKAQDTFIEKILDSEKLKVLFGATYGSKSISTNLSGEDLYSIEFEIQALLESFHNIQRPNDLFSRVIEEFKKMKHDLKIVSILGFLFSLIVPAINVAYFIVIPATYRSTIYLLLFYIWSILFTIFIRRFSTYLKRSKKLDKHIDEMATTVSESVYNIQENDEFNDIASKLLK